MRLPITTAVDGEFGAPGVLGIKVSPSLSISVSFVSGEVDCLEGVPGVNQVPRGNVCVGDWVPSRRCRLGLGDSNPYGISGGDSLSSSWSMWTLMELFVPLLLSLLSSLVFFEGYIWVAIHTCEFLLQQTRVPVVLRPFFLWNASCAFNCWVVIIWRDPLQSIHKNQLLLHLRHLAATHHSYRLSTS